MENSLNDCEDITTDWCVLGISTNGDDREDDYQDDDVDDDLYYIEHQRQYHD